MSVEIIPFLEGRAFDDEATRTMGLALDKARLMLRDKGQPAIIQEVIAKRIIAIAATGERDADQLARRALQDLGLHVMEDD